MIEFNALVGQKPRIRILEGGWWRLEVKDSRIKHSVIMETARMGQFFGGKNAVKDGKGPGSEPT